MATSLSKYNKKRDFDVSPEPAGKVLKRKGWSYVIQKHDASHLHYDFRLELDGVLKSWAVPKGPSLDPSVKRLAVEVEDHPVEYGSFEGVIPEGEYGGGTVLLWDQGSWEPVDDPHKGLRSGRLKFVLHGEKLQGRWMLVRSNSYKGATKPQWLLFKERDDQARPTGEGDILDEQPLSVVSDRDLDEIAGAKDRVWSSNKKSTRSTAATTTKRAAKKTVVHAATKKAAGTRTHSKASSKATPAIAGAKKKPMPKTIEVQLATLTKEPPQGEEWLHEIKFDGYRMICRKDGDQVRFISRNQQDWTSRLSSLAQSILQVPADQMILDGEVVALNDDGISDFQALQNVFRDKATADLKYYIFDLLYLDGQSLTELPLEQRKDVLAQLISEIPSDSSIRYSEHIAGSGEEFQKQACRLHLEGMISKRRDQPYHSGRGFDWLKTKCVKTEEFVIGGYTEPSGSRSGFGALLVGFHDENKQLKYAGKVGTGFDEHDLATLTKRLHSLERSTSPFADMRRKVGAVRTAHWVEPELVGQFTFASRTNEDRLRHASFQGLREDKAAKEVTMDRPVPIKTAVRKSKEEHQMVAKPSASGAESSSGKTKSKSKSRTTTDLYDAAAEEFAGVRLTSPDKVLYPDGGITKLDLANYYHDIADWILPHLAHRPIVLVRCPEGQKKECFYQKHPSVGTPEILRRIPIQEKHRKEDYLVVDEPGDLIGLAQVGALEIHAWGSREDKLEYPDRLIFDLDPAPDVPWDRVVESARQIRQFLQDLGLESFVKTTGGKGLHLVVPIDRRHDWDDAKAFCKHVADAIVAADPDHYTANMSKAARGGKIFLDYLRNGRGATAIIPYSTRSKPNATISTPLTWDELSTRITSDHFTIANIRQRLTSLKKDPWEKIGKTRQSLTGALKRLNSLSPPSK